MKHMKQTIAILLTLLMLVSAAPFAAFAAELTDAQKTCSHTWSNDIDMAKSVVKEAATCKTYAVYYKYCTKCDASAKDVTGAENMTVTDTQGGYDKDNHPESAIVAVKPEAESMKPCQVNDSWTPGKKCTACNTVLEEPVHYTVAQNHKVAEGQEATCQTEGFCQWCGMKIAEKNPNNHPKDKLETFQKEVPATCTQPGTSAGIRCKACGVTVQAVTITTKEHTGGTATCTKKAVCSVCGQEYGSLKADGHKLKKIDAKAAACTEKGNKEYYECEYCHKFFEDAEGKKEITDKTKVEIAPVETAHKNLKKTEAKASTCSATGNIEYWYCDACKYYYKDAAATQKITQEQTVVAKKDHTWGKMTMVSGSCTEGGKATHKCTVCQTSEEVNIVAGQHPKDAQKTTKGKAPTCTEAGTTDQISCELCGAIIKASEADPALGHDYKDVKATGKGDGTHTFTCNRCKQPGEPENCVDEKEPRDCKCDVCGQQLAHTFTNYVSDGNATCAADGTKTAVCDVCAVAKDTVPEEGSKNDAAHQYEWTDLDNATCLKNGERKGVCKICGKEVTEEITDSALGHIDPINVDWQYPDGFDCEVGGNRFKTCTRCGEITQTEPIEGRAHSPIIDPEEPKTCTTDGKSAGSHCDICGKILTAQVIYQAEGHKADANGFTVSIPVKCTVDGEEKATCAVCGETFSRKIPAPGHSYVDTVVAPTCTGKGYTQHKCSVCGEVIQDAFTRAVGHKMKQTITAATTENNGKVVQVCSVCGDKDAYKVYRIKSIKLSQTTFVRDSKSHKPSVTITDTKGNKLVKNTDYTLKFSSGRKAIGTYKVVITFKGEYAGKKTLKYKIVPPAVKSLKATAGAKSATLTWAKNKYADVYVVYCATAKDGKYKKLGSTPKLTYTATKLTAGKTYYFKVRAVRKLDSGNFYSADSAIKAAKIK